MNIPKLYNIPVSENFILPDHGSHELFQYITNIKINNENLFMKGFNNIPSTDIQYVFNITKEPLTEENINKVKCWLVFNRLANRICEKCGDKKDIIKLQICSECCLSWYCSEKCQYEDWNRHKLRCNKPDAPLDQGYQKIVLLQTE